MKKINVFETFSGIGAQSAALKNLEKNLDDFKYEVIGTSDWDIYSALSYAAIHKPNFMEYKDPNGDSFDWLGKMTLSINGKSEYFNTNRFQGEDLVRIYKAFKASNNIGSIVNSFGRVTEEIIKKKGKIDLLTYSFPCQDLSSAGSFHGFNEGIKKHTRSGLLFEIEKLLNELKKHDIKNNKLITSDKENLLPKFLLLENVVNLVQKTHKGDFDLWLKKLNRLGYRTIWGVINSHDFDQLQARRRVFAVSIYDPNNDIDWGQKNRSDLNEILMEIYKNEEYKPLNKQEHSNIFDFGNKYKTESKLSQIKNTPSRNMMIDKGRYISKGYKGKISTITTKQDRWPNVGYLDFNNKRQDKKGVPYRNKRFITPREAYYLMGFDKEQFEKAKNIMEVASVSDISARDKLYKQAGNSIAVNVLEMIFYYIQRGEY